MTKGVAAKGFKMTQGRKDILTLLVEEGGSIKSKEGKATSLMHGLLEYGGSMVSFNSTLRSLEELDFIQRSVEGRRTYEISITDKGRKQVDAEELPKSQRAAAAVVETEEATVDVTSTKDEVTPRPKEDWDWQEEEAQEQAGLVPSGVDYETLAMVLIQKAYHGMQQSSNAELDFYKQQNELAAGKIHQLEAQLAEERAKASSAIAERDQLQANFNILQARMDKKPRGGGDTIRDRLSASERKMMDQLMRELPTTKG